MRVLLAEDHKDTRELWTEALSLRGFDVTPVSNGADLLRLLVETDPPFIVILDLRMPRVSGYDVIDAVERSGLAPYLPMLAVSAQDPYFGEHSAIPFLRKPVSPLRVADAALELWGKALSQEAELRARLLPLRGPGLARA